MKRRTFTHISILIVFLGLGFTARAETIIGETIVKDSMIWKASGSPYRIQGNISIEPGASLTIEGGTSLVFEGKYGIDVGGQFRISGEIQSVHIEGMDLGNGKHMLWRSIRATNQYARITIIGGNLQDAEIAVDFSGVNDLDGFPEFVGRNSTFNNNLIVLKTANQGSNFNLSDSRFTKNNIALQGNYTSIDTTTPIRQVTITGCQFDSNFTAIQSGYASVISSQFAANNEAIADGMYVEVYSCGFERNMLAISGYGMKVEESNFFLNEKGIIHTGRNLLRDKVLRNSIIQSNSFESNQEALFLENGAMIQEINCNFFFKNDKAITLPDSLHNALNVPFSIEKNIFLQNTKAIQILELKSTTSPMPGTSLQPVRLIYNVLVLNFILIDHTSPNNLNFFKNYIRLADGTNEYLINLTLVDGDDKPGIGKVNFTLSGDTTMVDSMVTVNKIADIIKHNDYDSLDIAGNTYSFDRCASSVSTGIKEPGKTLKLNLYPNPCTHVVNLEWEDAKQIDFTLFGISGKEFHLENPTGLTSPARFQIDHLAPGIYFLVARSHDGITTMKFIKE